MAQYVGDVIEWRADQGGGGPGGPPNFKKRGKTSPTCAQKRSILVLNSYLDPTPPSDILYPPLGGLAWGSSLLYIVLILGTRMVFQTYSYMY